MLLVDSSVIIATFRKNEVHHKEALNIVEYAQEIVILDYVLSEVLTVLKMRESTDIALKCLDFLTNNNNIHIRQLHHSELTKAIIFFKENKNTLSFVDTALIIYSRSHTYSFATFDKELQKYFSSL